MREREKKRERQTERQRERQTERQRERRGTGGTVAVMFARFVSTPAQLHPGEVLEKIKVGGWGRSWHKGREGELANLGAGGGGGGGGECGAATSTIFVATKVLWRPTKHAFCRNKSILVATKHLSVQTYVCRDKNYTSCSSRQ